MGHIDHGKSTLLDFIRKSNVVAGEAGGITQHLGAYEVEHTTSEGKKTTITFLDTPGHHAFCGIRSRGARVADIAILVVSADDGVKPQTLEALGCITAEKLPYIVAINKIDKPDANIERTKQSLAEHEVYVEGYGGNIPAVPISALKGQGVPELLDMICLMADLEELTASPTAPCHAVVIEAHVDNKKGIAGSVIIQDGTLTSGNVIVAGNSYAPIRMMENAYGVPVRSATFSTPVRIFGWTTLPIVGTTCDVVATKKEAEALVQAAAATPSPLATPSATLNSSTAPGIATSTATPTSTPGAVSAAADATTVFLPIILKADVTGSLEGLLHEVAAIDHPYFHLKILSATVGDINESDIKLAQSAPGCIIFSFHSKLDSKAKPLAERTGIIIEHYDIIYKLTERLAEFVAHNVPKRKVEVIKGTAKILALFNAVKDRQVIGGKVQTGVLTVGASVKVFRRGAFIAQGTIRELQKQKERAREVAEGYECGMMIECSLAIAAGDTIEAFVTEEV
jgi:translation initiation factor IF-2